MFDWLRYMRNVYEAVSADDRGNSIHAVFLKAERDSQRRACA